MANMKRVLIISAALVFCAPSAFAWDLPQQVNTAKLQAIGQGNKYGPATPEAFALPALMHTARLSVIGQGDKYGPSPSENFSLPAQVKTKALSVVGHP